jgi:hypothetical protein
MAQARREFVDKTIIWAIIRHSLASAGDSGALGRPSSSNIDRDRPQLAACRGSARGACLSPAKDALMAAKPDQTEHHPHHRKFNPTQAVENIGVVIFILLGVAMAIGLLTAQGHLRMPSFGG